MAREASTGKTERLIRAQPGIETILHDHREERLGARLAEDRRLIDLIAIYIDADLAEAVAYQTTSGKPIAKRSQTKMATSTYFVGWTS
jgi:hypothetical protein